MAQSYAGVLIVGWGPGRSGEVHKKQSLLHALPLYVLLWDCSKPCLIDLRRYSLEIPSLEASQLACDSRSGISPFNCLIHLHLLMADLLLNRNRDRRGP